MRIGMKQKHIQDHDWIGPVRVGTRTTDVVKHVRAGDIVIIDHADLDETAAVDLCLAKPAVIINASPFMTGDYEARGARYCLNQGVPLYEMNAKEWFHLPNNGERVRISPNGWMQSL